MRVALLVAAALVAGWSVNAPFNRAAAGPVASADPSTSVAPTAAQRRGRAYFFRGFVGWVFSRGMDRLAERIEQAGYRTAVSEAAACPTVAKEAIQDYRRDPSPIIVFGHSVGGACALAFAEMLDAENIPVRLLVTTDPAKISHDVPPNVGRYINIFQSDSVLGGRDVRPRKDFQGHYASFDLVEHKEVTHLNIEKTAAIHDQLVTKIQQLAATPAKGEGETVPIRCVVPASADIELWDSGTSVFARSGDTLPQLATLYRLPLWSLVQINRFPDSLPLRAGQRIVVPRHLAASGALDADVMSDPATPKR